MTKFSTYESAKKYADYGTEDENEPYHIYQDTEGYFYVIPESTPDYDLLVELSDLKLIRHVY